LVLGTLVATLGAGGCKEDDTDEPAKDAGNTPADSGGNGGTDSGATDAGAKDSGGGTDAAMDAAPPVMCGTPKMLCTEHKISDLLPATQPGCATNAADAEVCGISSTQVLMGGDPKFFEKNAPGKDSPSCGAFFDSVEPVSDAGVVDGGGKGNMAFDTNTTILGTIMVALKYPGCCTPNGYCSINGAMGMSSVTGGAYMPSNNGYGCVNPAFFFKNSAPALAAIPCDADSGMIKLPASDGGTDGGSSDGGSSDGGASDAGADGGNS
jgi:hypothetical protein